MNFDKFVETVLLTLRGDVMAASGLLHWWRKNLPLDGEIEAGPVNCKICGQHAVPDYKILDGFPVCRSCFNKPEKEVVNSVE